jgi:polygalacturonase
MFKSKCSARLFLGALVTAGCFIAFAAGAPQACVTAPKSSLVVNVKDKGAKGDGQTEDTAAIQAAIDEVGGTEGTVLVPKGTYMVDAVDKKQRLSLRGDMTLKLADGATLNAIPNDSRKYSVLSISGASNVTVVGGTLEGDRAEHRDNEGEAGMGIRIEHDANNVTISGVTSRKMWGDGFYVEGATDAKFCGVTAASNRRQGLSIVEANGVLVTNSVFSNTRGTRPSAGVNLEPDNTRKRSSMFALRVPSFSTMRALGSRSPARRAPSPRSSSRAMFSRAIAPSWSRMHLL